jgi:hypothetical protein
MRSSNFAHSLYHGYYCYNQKTVFIEIRTKETNSLYGTSIKLQFFQIGKMSKPSSFHLKTETVSSLETLF